MNLGPGVSVKVRDHRRYWVQESVSRHAERQTRAHDAREQRTVGDGHESNRTEELRQYSAGLFHHFEEGAARGRQGRGGDGRRRDDSDEDVDDTCSHERVEQGSGVGASRIPGFFGYVTEVSKPTKE